jgi:hypothetical protein
MSQGPETLPERPRQILIAAAGLDSLVLTCLFVLARPWGILHGIGIALGAAALLAAMRAWKTGAADYGAGVVLALSLQTVGFLGSAGGAASLAQLRPVQVAALVAYLAILSSFLLIRLGWLAPGRAALTGSAIALGVLGVDAVLGRGAPTRIVAERQWPDPSVAHPRLGRVPRPYSGFATYYADDRHGYLLEEDLRAKAWEFSVMPGSVAELVLPKENPKLLRVAIRKANPDTVWHVQVFQFRFEIERRVPYYVTFRARADRPRKIWVGVAQHHPPWTDLGLYASIDLTPDWKEFREPFLSRRADTNAMIVFHLAGSDVPVELDSVTLHSPPSGQRVDPILSTQRFFIRYQRNGLGCRDRDYGVPGPNRVRILALGDGFTAGVDVHVQDAFPRLLERELNGQPSTEPRAPGYEVINCGVPAYGTREQRLFFELFGATYKPDLVLVTMGWNDDRFYWEERQRELIQRGPGRLERLSSVLHRIRATLRLRRTYDYRRSVEDLRALDKAVRAQGARLIVAVSRHGPDGLGDSVLATVRKGLAGSEIPLLDLGRLTVTDSGPGDSEDLPGLGAHRAAALQLLRWLRKDVLPTTANTARTPRAMPGQSNAGARQAVASNRSGSSGQTGPIGPVRLP